MPPDDDITPKAPMVQVIQAEQQQSFSRSDIATTKRAVQDLKDQTQKLSNSILQIAARSADCSKEAFEAAWQQRELLNAVHQQLASLEQQFSNYLPHASTARLTDKERKEILGLYSSGLYTQAQLADQYGVTQPTISDIIQNQPRRITIDRRIKPTISDITQDKKS